MKTPKIPKDLGIVMVSKEEAFWTDVKEKTEKEIETLEKMLKFNRAILEMAKQKIKDEVAKKGEKIIEEDLK